MLFIASAAQKIAKKPFFCVFHGSFAAPYGSARKPIGAHRRNVCAGLTQFFDKICVI
jgi:hypothetical protein